MKYLMVYSALFLSIINASVSNTKRLNWIDPYGREPLSYMQWTRQIIPETTTQITTLYKFRSSRQEDIVDIVVNAGLYTLINTELDTFIQDLIAAGYGVQVDTITGMSHTQLRSHLASIRDLAGAILVGETPVAWFETNGFGGWEEFPHDLYFCDLNGIYTDGDEDGIYDDHTGSVEPEIWIGRIYARNLTWDSEVSLVKNYFHKNHAYRINALSIPDQALSFVDDDWSYWTTCYLDAVYPSVTVINDEYQTTASNYRTQLCTGYEWIHICAHSSPWGHTFRYGYSGEYMGTVFNYDIYGLEPYALFYNLFACSGTRFVEENHSAGWYIFVAPYGLLTVGSTKTGSMLNFEDFYIPIGQQHMCIGDALKHWFSIWGEQSWDWFYGMNILGDPTLKPRHAIAQDPVPFRSHPIIDPPHRYWQDVMVIAADNESDGFPHIATTANNTPYIVWQSGRSMINGRSDIFSADRSSGAWSNASEIGSWGYWDYYPAIGIDANNHPVAVWASYEDGQYDLYYSVNIGAWTARQRVHAHDPAYDINPCMILDKNDRLWVAWESRRNINQDIYACFYNGSSWSAPQQVTTFTSNEIMPVMAVDSTGRPWVFFCRQADENAQIWGSYYDGSQWLSIGPVSGPHEQAYCPGAAVSGNDSLYVAWQAYDLGNADIYISHSLDGMTWSVPEPVTTAQQSDVLPVLAAHPASSQNEIWLAYQSHEYGEWNIHSAFRRNGIWYDHIGLIEPGPDINPRIASDLSGEIWLCWQNGLSGNWEIMAGHCSGYGIEEYKGPGTIKYLSAEPTPFSSCLYITASHPGERIRIYDINGSLVTILHANEKGEAVWQPDISTGVYYVIAEDNDKASTQKVVYIR